MTPKYGKYRAPRATQQEVRETLRITEADKRIVRKVMKDLGYIVDEPPPAEARGRDNVVQTRPVGKTVRKAQPAKER